MEVISEFFSFLKESIKIIPKNGKLTALLSLLLPSIIFLSFSHLCHQYLPVIYVDDGPDSGYDPSPISNIPLLLLFFSAEIALSLVYLLISHVSVIAAILVASASCTGNNLSSKDLFTSMKTISWRKTFSAISHVPRSTWNNCLLFIFFLAYFILLLYPDILTISNLIIAWTVIVDFLVYSSSDVWALALVVLVLEEEEEEEEEGTISCCSVAMEKLGDLLVEGHKLKGSMLNLFNTLLFIIVCILVWVFKYQNPTLYGLIFINALSTMKMVLFMAYAVLYFQCKKHPAAAGYEEIC